MNLTEIRDSAGERLHDAAGAARKAAYAAVGAPVLAGRRLASYRGRMADAARREFDLAAGEGEKLAEGLRTREVVTDLKEKVDLDHVKDRVEKLRDRLEGVLDNWKDSFRPGEGAVAPEPAAKKPAAKKPAAKKPAAKKPAAKKPAAGKPAAEKPAEEA